MKKVTTNGRMWTKRAIKAHSGLVCPGEVSVGAKSIEAPPLTPSLKRDHDDMSLRLCSDNGHDVIGGIQTSILALISIYLAGSLEHRDSPVIWEA